VSRFGRLLRLRLPQLVATGYVFLATASISYGLGTPQFARETKLPCSSCHTHVPQLNAFGQKFFANGFKLPKHHEMFKTIPVWVEANAQGTTAPSQGPAVQVAYDDSVIGSNGYLDKVDVLYHALYGPVGKDLFELYGIHPVTDHLGLFAGKTVVMSQFDPGLDISGTSLDAYMGPAGTNPNAPPTAMGPFSPGGTTTFVRGIFNTGSSPLPYADGWHLAATVPFANEFTDSSGGGGPRADLSSKAKGAFVEGYLRQGMNSYGINMFSGADGRRFLGSVAQKTVGPVYLQGGAAYAEGGLGGKTHVYSISADWIPKFDTAFAFRIDSQNGDLSYVPLVSYIVGGKENALQFQVESAFSRGVGPTTTFTAVLRF